MINGKAYSYYGFVPMRHNGFLDMPSRLGETSYDWGDEIQPLVHSGDIFWSSRDLTIDVLYDHRITELTFREAIAELRDIEGEFNLVNIYGTQSVKFRTATKMLHPNDNFATFRLLFNEQTPTVARTVAAPEGGSGITIDGYSLMDDFGLLVQRVLLYDDVPDLKASPITTNSPQKGLADHRQLGQLDIRATTLHSTGYIDRVKDLQSILGAPGLRTVVYNGVSRNCFLTEGAKVTSQGRGHSTLQIKLNIAQA